MTPATSPARHRIPPVTRSPTSRPIPSPAARAIRCLTAPWTPSRTARSTRLLRRPCANPRVHRRTPNTDSGACQNRAHAWLRRFTGTPMKSITRIACAVLAAVVVAGCTYRIDESNIVIARSAPPVDLSVLHAEFPGYRIEPAAITTPDGNRLQSLRFVREDAGATVLYFGGNGYTVARFAPRTLAVYRDLPVNVVLVDHRGYGGSSGTPTVETLMADAGLVHAQVRADPAFAGM